MQQFTNLYHQMNQLAICEIIFANGPGTEFHTDHKSLLSIESI
jgi:hypothetical protein